MVGLALIGFLPMVPLVFGFFSATVTTDTYTQPAASTVLSTAPTTNRYIVCNQLTNSGTTLRIRRGTRPASNFLHCTNYWHSAVDITVTLQNGNGIFTNTGTMPTQTQTAVAPGAGACFNPASPNLTVVNTNRGPSVVTWVVTVSNTTNLWAQLYFQGNLQTVTTPPALPACTP